MRTVLCLCIVALLVACTEKRRPYREPPKPATAPSTQPPATRQKAQRPPIQELAKQFMELRKARDEKGARVVRRHLMAFKVGDTPVETFTFLTRQSDRELVAIGASKLNLLLRRDSKNQKAIAALQALLDHKQDIIRQRTVHSALNGLSRTALRDKAFEKVQLMALKDPSPMVRKTALNALWNFHRLLARTKKDIKVMEAFKRVAKTQLKDSEALVRGNALVMWCLSKDPECLPAAIQQLKASEPFARVEALRAVKTYGDSKAIPRVAKLLDDKANARVTLKWADGTLYRFGRSHVLLEACMTMQFLSRHRPSWKNYKPVCSEHWKKWLAKTGGKPETGPASKPKWREK